MRHLVQLYRRQFDALQQQGRSDWLEDDFAALSNPARYQVEPQNAWRKVKGTNKLRGLQLAVLQQLCAWRERLAIDKNKPRRWIAADHLLLDIAKLRPKDMNALEKIRGIPASLVQHHGQVLLQCVRDAEALPKEQWPSLPRPKRLSSADEALVDALSAIIKLSAEQYQITPATLASRKELEQLVNGEREVAILRGWRRHHGGDQLLEFIQGKARISVRQGRLVLSGGE